MGSKNEEKPSIKSWFQGLKAEFYKIVWPDKNTLVKEAVAVIIIAVIVGIIIGLLDRGLIYGLDALKDWVSTLQAQ